MWLEHPRLAQRDCQHCRAFVYDEDTGEPQKQHNGALIPRVKGAGPPCEVEGYGCPKGHWSHPVELSNASFQAYRHFLRCEAVGRFPDDVTVAENAAIIRRVARNARHGKPRRTVGVDHQGGREAGGGGAGA